MGQFEWLAAYLIGCLKGTRLRATPQAPKVRFSDGADAFRIGVENPFAIWVTTGILGGESLFFDEGDSLKEFECDLFG
jgi:hypothetical protein